MSVILLGMRLVDTPRGDKVIKTSNGKCRELVQAKVAFTANNIFAEHYGALYVVYSYGVHFPMYVFDGVNNVWMKNTDKYSMTTSKHQTQACPFSVETMLKASTQELKEFINKVGSR